jgi:hypothetical protein
MLPLVQSKALDEAPYKLSRAIAKLAGITFSSLPFSYWFDKPWFLTEGRLATMLIIPSSWGFQLGGYLPASATREKTTFLCPRTFVLFTLRTLFNAFICCSQPSTQRLLG